MRYVVMFVAWHALLGAALLSKSCESPVQVETEDPEVMSPGGVIAELIIFGPGEGSVVEVQR